MTMDIKQDNIIGFKDLQLSSSSYTTDNENAMKPQCDISLSFYTVGSKNSPENKYNNTGTRINILPDTQSYLTESSTRKENVFSNESSGNANANTKTSHLDSSKIFDKSFYKSILIESSPRLSLSSQSEKLEHRRASEMQLTPNNKQFLNDETRQAVENIRGTMAAIADRRVLFFSESPKSPLFSPSSRLSYDYDNTHNKFESNSSPTDFGTSFNKPIKDCHIKQAIETDSRVREDKESDKNNLIPSSTISNSTNSTFNILLANNHANSLRSTTDSLVESSIPMANLTEPIILPSPHKAESTKSPKKTSIPKDPSVVKLNSSDGAMYVCNISFPKHSEFWISDIENSPSLYSNSQQQSPEIKYYSVPEGTTLCSGDSGQKSSTSLWPTLKSADTEKVFFSDTILNEDPNSSHESKSMKVKKSSKNQNPKIQSPLSKHKKSTGEKEGGGSHKESWKGKVARTIMRYGSGTILSSADPSTSPVVNNRPRELTGVIGIPLEFCEPSPNNPFVPFFVAICTRVVEERGLDCLGIYRVPGNTGAIKELQDEINKDPKGLCLYNEKWQDVNLVTSLLKLYLRRLPDSLITDDLYEATINANRTDHAEKRMLRLKKILHELPDHNFNTLHHLAHHLNIVAAHEENNKMDMHNLAIMFGPTLIRPRDNNLVAMAKNMTDQCRIIETILSHCDWFFSSWDEDVNVPVDEESEDVPPISHINDQMVAKAQSLAASNSSSSSSLSPLLHSSRHLSFTNFSSLRSSAKSRFRPKDNPRSGSDCKSSVEPMRGHFSIDPATEIDVKVVYRPAFNSFHMQSPLCTENLKPQICHVPSFDRINLGLSTITNCQSKPE